MTTITQSHCFIFTGGPGAGKTTVLEALRKRGFTCRDEDAREIIKQQLAEGGDALPWGDIHTYRRLMLEKAIEAFEAVKTCAKPEQRQPVFFDRGIPDIIGYSRLIHAPVDKQLQEIAWRYRYNTRVFLFPPWQDIYHTDTERRQQFSEAIMTHQILRQVYREYGYETLDMPLVSVEERVQFILQSAHL